jgi:hypothetical protein
MQPLSIVVAPSSIISILRAKLLSRHQHAKPDCVQVVLRSGQGGTDKHGADFFGGVGMRYHRLWRTSRLGRSGGDPPPASAIIVNPPTETPRRVLLCGMTPIIPVLRVFAVVVVCERTRGWRRRIGTPQRVHPRSIKHSFISGFHMPQTRSTALLNSPSHLMAKAKHIATASDAKGDLEMPLYRL